MIGIENHTRFFSPDVSTNSPNVLFTLFDWRSIILHRFSI